MSSLFDELFPDYAVIRSNARLKLMQDAAESSKLSAMSKLYGGPDPDPAAGGGRVNWDPMQAPPTSLTSGGSQPQASSPESSSLTGGPSAMPTPPQGLTSAPDPNQFAQQRAMWLKQVDPESAMKQEQMLSHQQDNVAFMRQQGLPDNVIQPAVIEPFAPHTATAMATNLEVPENVKTLKATLAGLNTSKPGTPEYQAYQATLKKQMEDIPAAQQAELVRHDKATENLENIVMAADENGYPIMVDKRNKTAVSLGTPQPWMQNPPGIPIKPQGATAPQGSPAPAAVGQPPASVTPPAGNEGPLTPPANVPTPPPGGPPATPDTTAKPPLAYNDPFISQMPQEAQQRFAQLPSALQLLIGPMLQGKISPPEGGRIYAKGNEKALNLLRAASFVDPSFNEQTWLQRNTMAKEEADMTAAKLGGQRASAEKILNHGMGFLSNMADLHNNSVVGTLGNEGDNAVAGAAPDWMGQQATQTSLKDAAGHAEGTGSEFEKMMGGGTAAEGAKKRAGELMSTSDNLAGTIGGVRSVAEMMKGQVEPQLETYNRIMGTNKTLEDWLGPEASAKYKLIQSLATRSKAGEKIPASEVKTLIQKLSGGTIGVGETKQIGKNKVTRVN